MARFSLTAAHVFPGGATIRAGRVIADSIRNAKEGDFIVFGLSSATVTPDMTPLDGAATSMKAGSPHANTPARAIDGRGSID